MKVSIEVTLKPFNVPNYVLTVGEPVERQDGMKEASKYRLSELSAEVLEQLCEEFTKAVFEKAGKRRPPTVVGE